MRQRVVLLLVVEYRVVAQDLAGVPLIPQVIGIFRQEDRPVVPLLDLDLLVLMDILDVAHLQHPLIGILQDFQRRLIAHKYKTVAGERRRLCLGLQSFAPVARIVSPMSVELALLVQCSDGAISVRASWIICAMVRMLLPFEYLRILFGLPRVVPRENRINILVGVCGLEQVALATLGVMLTFLFPRPVWRPVKLISLLIAEFRGPFHFFSYLFRIFQFIMLCA